jgi:hypothetical protein
MHGITQSNEGTLYGRRLEQHQTSVVGIDIERTRIKSGSARNLLARHDDASIGLAIGPQGGIGARMVHVAGR